MFINCEGYHLHQTTLSTLSDSRSHVKKLMCEYQAKFPTFGDREIMPIHCFTPSYCAYCICVGVIEGWGRVFRWGVHVESCS